MTPNQEGEALGALEPVHDIGLFLNGPEQKPAREYVTGKGCQISGNPGRGKRKSPT